jgi:hypothetical protein
MRHILAVCAVAVATSASAATIEPVRPPTGHPLIGKWQWTRSSNKCTEVYDFRPDGTAPVISGDEKTDNLYTISPDPDVNGFYRLSMRITKDHGGTDCADDASDSTGAESTNYLRFSPDGSEYIACLEPRTERCYGPLRRLRQ